MRSFRFLFKQQNQKLIIHFSNKDTFFCPIDKTKLKFDEFFDDLATEKEIQHLQVSCQAERCNWTGELNKLEVNLEFY